jgi:hypothetical protein
MISSFPLNSELPVRYNIITNQLIIYDIDFIYVKAYLLLIKFFFIFNINLYLTNESIVKIKSLGKKCFTKKFIK